MATNQTGGQAAIALLERYGVDTVFGIPGVHTLELYRGLADSKIRHIAGRPRPVHIELPLDLLAAPGPRLGERAAIAAPPAPAPDLIAKAAALIAGARRPIILAGGGMVDHGGVVKALAEKIGAAIIPTVAAKGAVPDSHPLCVGSTLSLPPTQELLRSADVVIAV